MQKLFLVILYDNLIPWFRTIAAFYQQDRGDIYIEDELINSVPAYQRNTAMVFQNYAVFPHMTVFDNVAYGLRVRKLPKELISQKVMPACWSTVLKEITKPF